MTTTEHTVETTSAFRKWMLPSSITLATTIYGMTVLIVSVVLPQFSQRPTLTRKFRLSQTS